MEEGGDEGEKGEQSQEGGRWEEGEQPQKRESSGKEGKLLQAQLPCVPHKPGAMTKNLLRHTHTIINGIITYIIKRKGKKEIGCLEWSKISKKSGTKFLCGRSFLVPNLLDSNLTQRIF